MTSPDTTEANQRALGLAREMIDRIADKWTLLVIAALGKSDTLRFTQLRDSIDGISQKMLTQTLRQLERDGLVSRHVYPVVPPKVEYRLTELGGSLLVCVTAICGWVSQHVHDIEGARQAFDGRGNDFGA
jgi:DNA-binding HxlR family transcriptional regulator